jgi:hypothetical protein
MDHLRALVTHFKEKHPDLPFPRPSAELFTHIQTTLLPNVLAVVQKDNALFKGYGAAQIFPGVAIETIWDSSDESWKKLHMALLYSLMQGDPKEKISKIIEAVKTMLPGAGGAHDEILKILENEETESSLMEMFELVVNTRLASVVGDLMSSINLDDLNIDFENPEHLLAALQNPEQSELVQTIMKRAQELLQEKISTGKIDQRELVREIETLRAKFQSTFGKYMNEMVVGAQGNTTGTDAKTIMSNSPDARRARMLARLQKKQREKSRK